MKKTVGIVLGVVFLLIVAVLAIPAFVDLGAFKRTYLPMIEEVLQRRVDVGEVRLSLIPTPSIQLSSLKVSDIPAFPDNIFFAAEQLQLRVKLWPLMRGRFEVTEFVLEKPVINLLKQPDGSFNYADLADRKIPVGQKPEDKKKPLPPKAHDSPTLPFVVPNRMRIKDGQLNFETKGQEPLRINGIDLSLQEFTGDQPFPYRASFSYPGLKMISLEGWLSFQEEQATVKLKDNRLKIHDLVLPVDGSVSHLSTTPRFQLSSASDQLEAKSVFQILSILGLAPSDTDFSGPMGLRVTVTGPSSSLISQIRGQFKDVKVRDARAVKGSLNGEVFIKLPLAGGAITSRLQGDGKLIARDGELTNVDLIKRIQRMTGTIGLSKQQSREATTFKILVVEFTVARGLADIKRVHLNNPQLEVNGGGTVTLDNPTLNMALETALSAQASARAGRGKKTTFFKDSQGRIVVPLKITGPVENPSVNLDVEKMAEKGMTRSLEKGLGSFFRPLLPQK